MLIIALVSCKSVTVPASQNKTLESIVAEKLGENALTQKNKDAMFALCTKENPSTLSVSYLIIKLNDLTVVEQGSASQASFSWINTYQIEIRTIPGIVKKEAQAWEVKIIDVTKYMNKL